MTTHNGNSNVFGASLNATPVAPAIVKPGNLTSVDGLTYSSITEGLAYQPNETPASPAGGSSLPNITNDVSIGGVESFIESRMIGPQPIIMSSLKLPQISVRDMDTIIETSQFERQVIKESITIGVEKAKSALLSDLGKSSDEELRKNLKSGDDKIKALAYMLNALDAAAKGLDILEMSPQIMQRATDSLAEILAPSERSNLSLPRSIDDYISITFPFEDRSSISINGILTNTARLIVLAQDMLMACLSTHPALLTHFTRGNLSKFSGIFSVPGAYGYAPDGPMSKRPSEIPIVTKMFDRNIRTIKKQFLAPQPGDPSYAFERINQGFLSVSTESTSNSKDEMLDNIVHSICMLSNEMILSAGIGRLQDTRLGRKFLETRPARSQVDPFIRLLGCSPTATGADLSKFFLTGPDRTDSFLDLLALGEERLGTTAIDRTGYVVMPFEANTVKYGSVPYVAGKDYFLDYAVRMGDTEDRSSLGKFSMQYSDLIREMSSYMTELMALDVSTPLAPELLMARIFQDFRSVLFALVDGISSDEYKAAIVAALFSYTGFDERREINSPDGVNAVMASDILKMSVVKALREIDEKDDPAAYVLSKIATDYETLIPAKTTATSGAPTTTFTAAPATANPEISLRSLWIPLLLSSVGIPSNRGILDPRNDPGSLTFSGIEITTNNIPFLHDTFPSKVNLINLISQTIREIQKNAHELAQRAGSTKDYRNTSLGTHMSNCDDDRLIDVICTIYLNLSYVLFPVSLYTYSEFKGGNPTRVQSVAIFDKSQMSNTVKLLDDVINSLTNGLSIDEDGVRLRCALQAATEISRSPQGGDNTLVTNVGDVVNLAGRFAKHRYYVKSSLKVLEATAACASASYSLVSKIFDILNDSVEPKTLKGSDSILYNMFVTNIEENAGLLRNVKSEQVNLCAAAKKIYEPLDTSVTVHMRSDIDTTTAERLALRDYIKSIYTGRNLDDIQLITLALPAGILESLYTTEFLINEKESRGPGIVAKLGTEAKNLRGNIRIEMSRFDHAHVGIGSSSKKSSRQYYYTPPGAYFDPEIFVFPDSIRYDPNNPPAGSRSGLDAIFKSTIFYRLRNGAIIETLSGAEVSPAVAPYCISAVRSYLLDLYLYETIGLRYYDGLGPSGSPRLSKAGHDFIRAASKDEKAARALVNKMGFDVLFDPSTRRVKSNNELVSLLESDTNGSGKFDAIDVKFSSLLSCVTPMCDVTDTVRYRSVERIYHFLYDEAVVRNALPSYAPSSSASSTPADRRSFDIYSLAASVVKV